MSVDFLHSSSSPPLKRMRDSSSTLPTILNTKCGEIFVNSNWDKWSFNCAFCQKTTSDIGVFICHIRLQHLNDKHISNEFESCINNSATNDSSITQTNIFSSSEEHSTSNAPHQTAANTLTTNAELLPSIVVNSGIITTKVSKIINLETLTDPPEGSDKLEDINSNKNSITTNTQYSNETNEEFLALSSIEQESQQQEPQEQQIIQVVYNGDDEDYNEFDTKHLDIESYLDCYLNDNDYNSESDHDEMSNDDNVAGVSRAKKPKSVKNKKDSYTHECPNCDQKFKSKQGVYFHYSTIHDKNLHLRLPHKCKICKRGFKTVSGLNTHKICHDKKRKQFKCPICSSIQYREYVFLNHIQTHETSKCFPCQVCGKAFNTDAERMKHWKSHAKERPYACKFCFRRFYKEQYLIQHLKRHCEYKCYFCPITFQADEHQKVPYVCPSCQQMPDINEKVQHIRNLQNSSHVFESDDEEENVIPSAKPFGINTKEFPEIIPKKEPEESLELIPKEEPQSLEEKEKVKEQEKEIKHIFYINKDSHNDDDTPNTDSDNCSDDVSYKVDSDISSSDDSLTDDDDNSNKNIISSQKKTRIAQDNKYRQIPDKEKPLCPASYKCKICNLQIYSKHILTYHMLKVHGEKYDEPTMYTCRYCQKTYRSVNGLTNHLKTHNDKNFIQCPVCKSKYLQNFYVNHVLTHESNICFPCQVCGKVFASNEERIKHWKTHAKEFPYSCEFCYRRFRKEQYLVHHLKTHYQYRCNFCGQVFNAEQSQKSPYVCGNCREKPNVKRQVVYERSAKGYSANNSNNIITNDFFAITNLGDQENEQENKKEIIEVVYINDDEETGNKDREFIINNDSTTNDADEVEPDNVSETESNYIPSSGEEEDEDEEEEEQNNELQFNTGVGVVASTSNTNIFKNYVRKYPFQCQYCPRDFKSQRGVNYHQSQVHDEKYARKLRHKCKKCDKAFQTFQGLLAHKRFHDKDCHFKCPVCPVKNHVVSHFLKHVMTHKSDTCHPCQVCGIVFSTDQERLKHWNTHAEELPYDCDVCSRRFRKMHILTHHKKCHGQYNCYFCPAIFNSKLTLHPPYVCPSCEKEPDIKQKVEFQRSLAEKKHVFDSDEEE